MVLTPEYSGVLEYSGVQDKSSLSVCVSEFPGFYWVFGFSNYGFFPEYSE
jgi:hypothetical protein